MAGLFIEKSNAIIIGDDIFILLFIEYIFVFYKE